MKKLTLGVALVSLSGLVACGDDGAGDPSGTGDPGGPFTLLGGAEKGPFILGSSVEVRVLDAAGNPTGDQYSAQIEANDGAFSVALPGPARAELEASGFYFNELTGELSASSLTMRALADVDGASPVYVNLVTHLTYLRARELVEAGAALGDAVAQAEGELVREMGIGVTGFDPGAAGTGLSLLAGDTDANAYLLAVGAVWLQAAATEAGPGGSLDATFQEQINEAGLLFAVDGTLPGSTRDALEAAEIALDGDEVNANLAARFTEIGVTGVPPDIHRVLDQDGDELVNAEDNCPRVANPDQLDEDANGIGDACECGNGVVDPNEACDDGNDVDFDACRNDCTFTCEKVAEMGLDPRGQTGTHRPVTGFVEVDGKLIVLANDYEGDIFPRVWVVDPVAGTRTVLDAIPYVEESGTMLGFGGRAYISRADYSFNLWSTDGTEAGTIDTGFSMPGGVMALANGSLFFAGADLVNPSWLRRVDANGTISTVTEVEASDPRPFGDDILFWGEPEAASPEGYGGLWISDGTEAGTTRLFSAPAGHTPVGADGLAMVVVGSPTDANGAVWITDGTVAGSVEVLDVVDAYIGRQFETLAGFGYFAGPQGLVRTDGTVVGTTTLASNGTPFGRAGTRLVLGGSSGSRVVLQSTDGAAVDTLATLAADESLGQPISTGERVFVSSTDGRLWVSDGTAGGTNVVMEGLLELSSAWPSLFPRDGHVYFAADDGEGDYDAWRCATE